MWTNFGSGSTLAKWVMLNAQSPPLSPPKENGSNSQTCALKPEIRASEQLVAQSSQKRYSVSGTAGSIPARSAWDRWVVWTTNLEPTLSSISQYRYEESISGGDSPVLYSFRPFFLAFLFLSYVSPSTLINSTKVTLCQGVSYPRCILCQHAKKATFCLVLYIRLLKFQSS